jgi:hypothetical protein
MPNTPLRKIIDAADAAHCLEALAQSGRSWLKTCRVRSEDAINVALKTAKELFTLDMAIGCIRRCGFNAQPK